MARTTKVEMRKYVYTTVDTQNLELLGRHSTIATVTKEQALELAQQLISAAMDKETETVRVDFEMKDPRFVGDAPELCLYFGSGFGYVQPKIHWATTEGHTIFELSEEYHASQDALEAN
jgi:hypothetical protein